MTPTSPNQVRNRPAARVDAAMFEALLPNSSAPIIRSRRASRRLTMPALRLPSFSSRSMAARDEAVSAVSLPEKRNDSTSPNRTIRMLSQSGIVMASGGQPFGEVSPHLGGVDIGRNEGLADAAREDERELAALDLLVLRHQFHQPVDVGESALHLREMGRQADRRKVTR